jgi:phosphonoacetaldehyde hydrolase
MYAEFIPLQVESIGDYADPIPGVLETVAALRERGIKIGSNTGYNREMMDVLVPAAAAAGYQPDEFVCSNDVPVGRPAPWGALENARRMNAYPISAIVKVDDTPTGVEEGLNAGMWTVAVTETGNEVGLSLEDLQALDPEERRRRSEVAARKLARAGAHYVISGVGELLPCVDDIERRLAGGESP